MTNVPALVADVVRDVRGHCTTAVTTFGKELAGTLQVYIGVPVERRGGRVIRSKPGESPRMDTKAMWKSVTTETTVSGSRIVNRTGIGVFYSPILEEKMNRPHMSRLHSHANNTAASRISALLPAKL